MADPNETAEPPADRAPPEVDAEIVEDGYRKPAPSAAAGTADPLTDAPEPQPAEIAPGSKTLFGVPRLYALGAAAAAAVIVIACAVILWPKPAAEIAAPAKPAPAPATVTPEPAAPAASGKIANPDIGAVPPAGSPAPGRGLPPPPSAGKLSNRPVDEPQPAPQGDVGDALDFGAPAAAVAPEPAEAPQQEETIDAVPAEPVEDFAADPPPTEDIAVAPSAAVTSGDPQKLANDLDDLKSALSAARADSERQSADIAALREGLAEALVERDRRAGAEIADLRDRLDKLQSDNAGDVAQQAAATLALAGLERAVAAGRPFAEELEALARYAPRLASIEGLRAIAETGAPTLATLKANFPAAARAARAAAAGERARGPIGAILARLEALISVRPAEPLAGPSPAAIISRAEYKLGRDLVADAVMELAALPAGARSAMSPWLVEASARLSVEEAVADIGAALAAPAMR